MRKFTSILMLASIVLSVSCNRQKESIGPIYYLAGKDFTFSNFKVPDTIDFRKSAFMEIQATFSSTVSWRIEIIGALSGAKFVTSGISDHLDSTIIKWKGGHDELIFFKSGEIVTTTVSFMGSDVKAIDKTFLKKTKDFGKVTKYITPLSIDSNGYDIYPVNKTLIDGDGVFPKQFAFQSCAGNGNAKVDNQIEAIQGTNYFTISGKSCSSDGYFVGGLQYRKKGFYFPEWTNPDEVYFNLYIYGTGISGTKLNLEFHEADPENELLKPSDPSVLNCATKANKGEHSPCVDDTWVKEVTIDHIGWKLISFPYSEFKHSTVPQNGDKGNFKKEPQYVHWIQITAISATPYQEINAIWDYPVISFGGPFNPSLN